ncbi:Na/Pi cotransporter family protein [Treponema succinifaciens]|uniref:Na/Pi cotransporter family protein n=1 Tax=Treponema succinifaciens TaxID=167 RepID=UPI00258A9F55|nr:Na/Pi cotransporter family protein [Treponema succinifaciens]MDY2615713.1 Na/Pi cotransporter family protein [Treponema succinifaciens]
MSISSILSIFLQFFGSLCFLLFGMKMMSDGIQKSAGDKLQAALHLMTGNRFTGFFTGCFLTMIIQSSGATTVMVVSFVNAGLIELSKSIAVILGANVGTTITAWIVAIFGFNFEISAFAIPLFGIGYLFTVIKKIRNPGLGQAIMGFGILFIALQWLSSTISLNSGSMNFLPALQDKGIFSYLIAFVIGIIVTAMIHSSSAMTAIVITMAYNQILTWQFSAAIIIGSNVGSTIDSVMASFGANANAKRTMFVHVLFNSVTAIVALIFIKPFTQLVDLIVPGTVTENITMHIAMLHSMFNIIGSVFFMPFVNPLCKLTHLIIKDDKASLPSIYKFEFPERAAHESPTIPVVSAQMEVRRMADISVQMFDRLQYGLTDLSGRFVVDHYDNLVREEDYLDQMQEQLTKYLLKCAQLDIDDKLRENINVMISITGELESMSDDCLSIGVYLKRITEKHYVFKKEDFDRLIPYLELARQLLQFIYKNINKALSKEQLDFANELESQIDAERKALKKIARKRLEDGADVKAELLYMDLVRQIEKIGDRCFNIAEQLALTK